VTDVIFDASEQDDEESARLGWRWGTRVSPSLFSAYYQKLFGPVSHEEAEGHEGEHDFVVFCHSSVFCISCTARVVWPVMSIEPPSLILS